MKSVGKAENPLTGRCALVPHCWGYVGIIVCNWLETFHYTGNPIHSELSDRLKTSENFSDGLKTFLMDW